MNISAWSKPLQQSLEQRVLQLEREKAFLQHQVKDLRSKNTRAESERKDLKNKKQHLSERLEWQELTKKNAIEKEEVVQSNMDNKEKGGRVEQFKDDDTTTKDDEGWIEVKRKEPRSRKLYVGNLDYATDENRLYEEFGAFGTVTDVFIPSDRYTQSPRGFCFVTFSRCDDAERAIDKMDQAQLDGRTIRVNEALSKSKKPLNNGAPVSSNKAPPSTSQSPFSLSTTEWPSLA